MLITILFISFIGLIASQYKKRPRHQGPVSHNFDGIKFMNPVKTSTTTLWSVIRWRLTGDHSVWPKEIIPAANHPIPLPTDEHMVVTFVNHASSLIQTGELNILTDPQYNNRASPVIWAGPTRVHEAGIAYEKLPKIDVVIISHDHYDHMDKETLLKLKRDHDPLFLAGLGNDDHFRSFGITEKVQTLDWWQTIDLGHAKFSLVPAQHFSGRWINDRNMTLWGSFIVHVEDAKVFFAGDTGYGPHFKEIQERFGAMDLAMLPIGSYEPRWFMQHVHFNPEDAVKAHLDLKSRQSYGIHFQTFQMSDEPYEQPAIDLEVAKTKHGIPTHAFVAPDFGQSFLVPKKST